MSDNKLRFYQILWIGVGLVIGNTLGCFLVDYIELRKEVQQLKSNR